MKLVILDYATGSIDVIKNVPNNIENFDDFLYNILEYKQSQVSWILLKDDARVNYYTYDSGDVIYDNENFIDDDWYKSL